MLRWTWARFDELHREELYDLLQLRQRVFVVEQACAFLDADGLDRGASHLLGHDDGVLVAAMRVLDPGVQHEHVTIGRVVTAPERRGEGLGHALVRQGLDGIRDRFGGVAVYAGAQARLAGFYGGHGFSVVGPPYDEDGIAHFPMVRPEEAYLLDHARTQGG